MTRPTPRLSNIPTITSTDDVISAIFMARGETAKRIDIKDLLPYDSLADIDKATEIVVSAIQSQEKILILGDFDADGATSTAILTDFLISLGARVDYTVPDRINEGYGLTPKLIDRVQEQFDPSLIITVDNGISSIDEVDECHLRGINVLITDHHKAGDTLPKALAIINPNRASCPFPSKDIAGVGVAFYLMASIRKKLNSDINITAYLDLVAIGTIADSVKIDHNNRLLVQRGLEIIRSGKARPGVRALLQMCGKKVDASILTYEDIGFFLAPKINAAGRLSDMTIGIRCLLETDYNRALDLALTLHNLNEDRKAIEKNMLAEALAELENFQEIGKKEKNVIVLFNQSWHQGIIGILASRIKERCYKPTIIFTSESDPQYIKASCRSVEGIHIKDVLAKLDELHPTLMTRFGGHAMAAGLSMMRENLPLFEEKILETIELLYPNFSYEPTIKYDLELPNSYLNLDFAKKLNLNYCFGQDSAVFFGRFDVLSANYLDGIGLQKFTLRMDASTLEATIFQKQPTKITAGETIKIVYQLAIKKFNNQESLQLKILHIV